MLYYVAHVVCACMTSQNHTDSPSNESQSLCVSFSHRRWAEFWSCLAEDAPLFVIILCVFSHQFWSVFFEVLALICVVCRNDSCILYVLGSLERSGTAIRSNLQRISFTNLRLMSYMYLARLRIACSIHTAFVFIAKTFCFTFCVGLVFWCHSIPQISKWAGHWRREIGQWFAAPALRQERYRAELHGGIV